MKINDLFMDLFLDFTYSSHCFITGLWAKNTNTIM